MRYRDGVIDIRIMQDKILSEARNHTGDYSGPLLSKLQHYGGETNLVDFTTDLNVALFFACGHPDKDGRVILQRAKSVTLGPIRRPKRRAISQKSVFIQPDGGYIDPEPRRDYCHSSRA